MLLQDLYSSPTKTLDPWWHLYFDHINHGTSINNENIPSIEKQLKKVTFCTSKRIPSTSSMFQEPHVSIKKSIINYNTHIMSILAEKFRDVKEKQEQ